MVMRARWERGVLEKGRVRRVRGRVGERVGRREVRKDIFVVGRSVWDEKGQDGVLCAR